MRVAMMGLAMAALAMPAMGQAHGRGLTVHLKTASGQDAGTAAFRETSAGVQITLKLKNLPAGDHGVHIHEKPLCEAPDFKSAGGHYNPEGKQHGTLNPMGSHLGDLPQNVTIGPDGTGMATVTLADITLKTGGHHNILDNGGTSIMVHAAADDMKTDPSGNSGARIACGVISAPMAPGAPSKN